MAAFDVVLSWSSGNVLFQTSTGGDICYIDGDSIRLVSCGSLVASSSAAITGNITVTKKVVGSSDASIAGTLTMGATATLTVPAGVMNCPEIRGRSDYDLSYLGSSDGGGIVLSATNPAGVDLWVERVYINVQTASSSSAYFTCGVANTASSSQSSLWPTTIACTTGGLASNSTEVSAPQTWESTGYFTAYVASSSDGSGGLDGTISVFYILPVTT